MSWALRRARGRRIGQEVADIAVQALGTQPEELFSISSIAKYPGDTALRNASTNGCSASCGLISSTCGVH